MKKALQPAMGGVIDRGLAPQHMLLYKPQRLPLGCSAWSACAAAAGPGQSLSAKVRKEPGESGWANAQIFKSKNPKKQGHYSAIIKNTQS